MLTALPIFLFVACALALALGMLAVGNVFVPRRPGRVKRMPYESGMDPIHDTRRRFDVRFHLLAVAFLVFDVELLFLYPWAVATRPAVAAVEGRGEKGEGRGEKGEGRGETDDAGRLRLSSQRPTEPGIDGAVAAGLVESRGLVFAGAMVFLGVLALGFVYDWRKGIFRWR